MKNDIVLAGVGGQGILTIASIIGQAAVEAGYNVKQSEVHGMSQRGGSVEAHLRISDAPIFADIIAEGTADVVLAVEPMEALRQRKYLSGTGAILANSKPVTNIGNYPELSAVHDEIKKSPKSVVVDAEDIAANLGNARAMNMVMLGAMSVFLDMPENLLTDKIARMFARKGEDVVKMNLAAFAAGKESALAGK